MSKNTRRPSAQPSPSTEQVAAIRRLAENGDIQQARRRLAALRKSFPNFKPLLGLAWEIEDLNDEPARATARALEWQQASPNSRAAVEAVVDSAGRAGFFMLCARAADRLNAMDGKEGTVIPASIDNPLGALTPEQALAMDLSRMHLEDDNTAAAIATLQGVDHPSARNNLALAWFADGQVHQALAVAEANWQAQPNNLFALCDVVRWRCWFKGMNHSLGLTSPLQHTTPLRAEDAIAQVLALRFLGDDVAAAQAWTRADRADFWTQTDHGQRAVFQNLQDPWAERPGSTAMWFPRKWLDAYRRALASHQHLNSALVAQHDQAFAAVCDAHTDYLVRVIQVGDEIGRHLAFSILTERAQHQREAVRDTLVTMLKSPTGSDSMRMAVLRWMTEEGLLSQHEPVDVWLGGGVQTMRASGWEISGEPQPSPFPPEGTELNARALTAMHARRFTESIDLFTQLHHRHPDKRSPLTNLTAVRELLKHSPDEIKALYQQAHALDPDYLFARCGLARYLAKEGRLEKAEALLEPVTQRTQFHCSEARVLLSTQREFALARGDQERVVRLTQALDDLQETYWGNEGR
jgi:tetratricopeptide (TPR) repeat protein